MIQRLTRSGRYSIWIFNTFSQGKKNLAKYWSLFVESGNTEKYIMYSDISLIFRIDCNPAGSAFILGVQSQGSGSSTTATSNVTAVTNGVYMNALDLDR